MDDILFLVWPLAGIAIHIWQASEMKTWCGTPIWQEPSTYVLFIPAMLLGPLMVIPILLEPTERR